MPARSLITVITGFKQLMSLSLRPRKHPTDLQLGSWDLLREDLSIFKSILLPRSPSTSVVVAVGINMKMEVLGMGLIQRSEKIRVVRPFA